MTALSRLQASVLFQLAADETVANEMSKTTRNFIAATALVFAASISAPGNVNAQQQNPGPLTPTNCAFVGGGIGGVVGAMAGKTSWEARTLGAAIGAFGGAVAGHYLCAPKEEAQKPAAVAPLYQQPRQQEYVPQPRKEVIQGAYVAGPQALQPLSTTEGTRLDQLSQRAMEAKFRWRQSLRDKEKGLPGAAEGEGSARTEFETERNRFATVVNQMSRGTSSLEPREVSRYLEVAAALMELPVQRGITYQAVVQMDQSLEVKLPGYRAEIDRALKVRRS